MHRPGPAWHDTLIMDWRRLLFVPVILFSAAPLPSQAPDVSTRAIVAAAVGYVAEYQRQLTSILADERYTQEIVAQLPRDTEMPRTRTLQSEVFFMFEPASRQWMAIRDVMQVDGQPLDDRPDLHEALRTLDAADVAATFKRYNSRFNIGRTFRNFNEPTVSLLVLDEHHRRRFSFERKAVERVDGDVLVTLAFKEKDPPTLIYDPKRGRVFSRGELLVEAGTGRVRRARLTAAVRGIAVTLTTDYRPEPRLAIWVPASFHEQYEAGSRPAGEFAPFRPRVNADSAGRAEYERIACQATYSNFRRFETSVRIR
jgi:hypothetical protein